MKLKILLKAVCFGLILSFGLMLSLSPAQDTYSELDEEVVKGFLAELDRQLESVSDDSLFEEEMNEIVLQEALEKQLEQFEEASNSSGEANRVVKRKEVSFSKASQEQPVSVASESSELAQMEQNLSRLKSELEQLTRQNNEKSLELGTVTLDAQLVDGGSNVSYVSVEPIAYVQDTDSSIEGEGSSEAEQYQREAQELLDKAAHIANESRMVGEALIAGVVM